MHIKRRNSYQYKLFQKIILTQLIRKYVACSKLMDLWKRMLFKCRVHLSMSLLQDVSTSSGRTTIPTPFRKSSILSVSRPIFYFIYFFHILMSLANLWFIRLKGHFSTILVKYEFRQPTLLAASLAEWSAGSIYGFAILEILVRTCDNSTTSFLMLTT